MSKLVTLFALGLWVAFVALDGLFETEGLKDEDVGAVEDQGQEEGEAAEVHVALGVEFAGLDFHAAGAFKHGLAVVHTSAMFNVIIGGEVVVILVSLLRLCEFHLDAVDAVDAINEEDEDEDKGNLLMSEKSLYNPCLYMCGCVPSCHIEILRQLDSRR